MKVKISYSKRAYKFLSKNTSLISEEQCDDLILKALKTLFKSEIINIDLKRMKGQYINHFRIRKGNIRIVFEVSQGDSIMAFIKIIDTRGNVY